MNRIRQLREEKRWTQKDLADKLCLRDAAISKYETERVPLTDETIKKLCVIFDVSSDYLLGLTYLKGKPDIKNDDELYHEIYEIVRGLSPENRQKLLELAHLYLTSQNKNKENS
jgi:transcriptional regulator with XRE-family HTH domain